MTKYISWQIRISKNNSQFQLVTFTRLIIYSKGQRTDMLITQNVVHNKKVTRHDPII